MGNLINVINILHKQTEREYLPRMVDEKVPSMRVAKKYGQEYWDGDRRYGYGGYKYDGRWRAVAKRLIETYSLTETAKILDVGCGKGFLLYELKQLLPEAQVAGFDISEYGLSNAKEEIRDQLFVHRAEDSYPYEDSQFDLVISINTLHNLPIHKLKSALTEIERVGKNQLISVESYRNEQELFNLQCWALTCEAFFTSEEWVWLFDTFGYTGDFEFIYFE